MRTLIKTGTPRLKALVAAIAGAVLGIFALFFIIANDSWVAINIPSAPWSPDPSAAAFEATVFAVILVSFAVGLAAMSLVWFVVLREQRKKRSEEQKHIENLENELENLNRLVASLKDGSGPR